MIVPPKVGVKHATVLMYHHIADAGSDAGYLSVSPRNFAEQMEVLRCHAQPISLKTLTAALDDSGPPPRSVLVTFDDGYLDNLTQAKPVLERFDIPATVFVTGVTEDTRPEFWWDEIEKLLLLPGRLKEYFALDVGGDRLEVDLGEFADYTETQWQRFRAWKSWEIPPTPRHEAYQRLCLRLKPLRHAQHLEIVDELRRAVRSTMAGVAMHPRMSASQVATMAEGGLIEIGGHTATHPMLSLLSPEHQAAEIRANRSHLEGILAAPVRSFAYPYGDFSPDSEVILKDAGFLSACTVVGAEVKRGCNPFQIPRRSIFDLDGGQFLQWLSGL